VRFSSILRLFVVAPQTPVGADGRMALADHLRELRGRLLRSVVVLIVALVVALFFYDHLLNLVLAPYNDAKAALGEQVQTNAYIKGAAGPLLLQLKLSGIAALVATSPFWLYQIWAFILPGLHPSERRWSRIFTGIAGPLFIAGVAVGYYVLPRGLEVLIGFTPAELQNLVEFGEYFSFFTRMLLVFGVAFEIPLFVVMLNLAGVVSGKALGEHRAWIIVGVFVFAAAATPSTDPFSMLMLALPMTVLFLVSEVVARVIDRRRSRELGGDVDDDQASPLEMSREDEDDRASDLEVSSEDDDRPEDYRRSRLDEDDD
jgi:sec-independent protein translocase protein TatC